MNIIEDLIRDECQDPEEANELIDILHAAYRGTSELQAKISDIKEEALDE
jgi:hypothetical protein